MEKKRFRVKIRRGFGDGVKPEAEQIDGKEYLFTKGWGIEDGIYNGEIAWLAPYDDYPVDAPTWIASGDLEELGGRDE